MRRSRWPIVATLSIALAAAAASPTAAQSPQPPRLPPGPPPGGSGMPPGEPSTPPPPTDAMLVPMLIRSVNLTADQEARVHGIMSARHATIRSLVDQLRRAEDDLADRLFATGSSGDLQTAVARVSQLREQLLQESTRAALEVRGVLTPDQLARAAYVKDRMRALQAEMRQLTRPARP